MLLSIRYSNFPLRMRPVKFGAVRAALLPAIANIFVCQGLYAQEPLSPHLIEALKSGHLNTCQTAIRNQSEGLGLGMTDAEIKLHCQCVGAAYFDSFTEDDFNILQNTGQLPPDLLSQRENIQATCLIKSLSP